MSMLFNSFHYTEFSITQFQVSTKWIQRDYCIDKGVKKMKEFYGSGRKWKSFMNQVVPCLCPLDADKDELGLLEWWPLWLSLCRRETISGECDGKLTATEVMSLRSKFLWPKPSELLFCSFFTRSLSPISRSLWFVSLSCSWFLSFSFSLLSLPLSSNRLLKRW